MRKLLASFFVASSLLLAEEPTPKPLVKSVEVNVTNVDVVVTDAQGRPVTDLKREDFVLKENGAEKPLTNFARIEDGKLAENVTPVEPGASVPAAASSPTAEAPTAPTHLVFFIDNLHLNPADRGKVLSDAASFIEKAVHPGVEGMVVSWDKSLHVRGSFTSQAPILADVVRRMGDENALGPLAVQERERALKMVDQAVQQMGTKFFDAAYGIATQTVLSYSESAMDDTDRTLGAIEATLQQIAGIEGRKAFFLVTERLPQNPGIESRTYLRDALQAANPTTVARLSANFRSDREYDLAERYQKIAHTANMAGVSVYSFDAAGLGVDATISAERGARLGTYDLGLEKSNSETMLRLLATETGGVAGLNNNDFGKMLTSLESDWKSYYSLGYATSASAKDRPKKLDVAVTRPGLKVRSRKSHVERTPEGRLADAVVSGLYFQKTYNPLRASLDIAPPKKSGKKIVVTLKFTIPYEKLTLVPEGTRYRGKLVFMGATREDSGTISDVARKETSIDVDAADLPGLTGKSYVFETAMEVKQANQLLSMGLTDGPSRLSSYVQTRLSLRGPDDAKKDDAKRDRVD